MIDLQSCEMSRWSGRQGRCRWCDAPLVGRQRSWCGPQCYREFSQNHHYSEARRATRERSRAACACPPEAFQPNRPGGRRLRPHKVCTVCRRCEAALVAQAVGVLECNHRTPRLGDRSSYSCLHHLSNLEMVCPDCHRAITHAQRSQWPARRTKAEVLAAPKRPVSRRRRAVRRHAA